MSQNVKISAAVVAVFVADFIGAAMTRDDRPNPRSTTPTAAPTTAPAANEAQAR